MKRYFFLLLLLPSVIFAQDDAVYDKYGSGIKAFYEQKYLEAIDFFTESIALKNDFTFAYYHRAQSFVKLNKLNEALPDFIKTIHLDSTLYDAYIQKADILIKQKEFELASADLEKLIIKQPQYLKAYKMLGLVFYYQRKYDLANDAFDYVLKSEKKDSEVWYQKGLVNFYAEKYEIAIQSFSNAFSHNENYLAAIDMRALSYHLFNENEKACADWKFVVDKGFTISEENYKKYCQK